MYKKHNNKIIRGSMGLLYGIPLMGAAATQVNALPAGTAKNIAGTAVGLQSVSLVAHAMPKMKKGKKGMYY